MLCRLDRSARLTRPAEVSPVAQQDGIRRKPRFNTSLTRRNPIPARVEASSSFVRLDYPQPSVIVPRRDEVGEDFVRVSPLRW